jgi:hypothetical protein
MSIASRMISSAAAALVVAAGATTAMAGSHVSVNVGDYFSGNYGHHYKGGRHVTVNVGGGGGCGYYRDKWEDTGRHYWKRKYYECKGW